MIEKKYLYATMLCPPKDKVDALIDSLKNHAQSHNVEITAIFGTAGPGCYNIAVKCQSENEENCEKFGKELALVLQPGRWTNTSDEFEGFEFTNLPG